MDLKSHLLQNHWQHCRLPTFPFLLLLIASVDTWLDTLLPEYLNKSLVPLLFFCHLLKKIPLLQLFHAEWSKSESNVWHTGYNNIAGDFIHSIKTERSTCKMLLQMFCKRNLAKEKSHPNSPNLEVQAFRQFLPEGSYPRHLQLCNIYLLLNYNGTRNGCSTACTFSGKCL